MGSRFLNLDPVLCRPEDAWAAVLPVPFDATTCYRAGARDGPARILEASAQMEFYDEETGLEPWREGIHTAEPLEPLFPLEAMAARVEEKVAALMDKELLPVVLGGDHSVSIGAMKAVAARAGGRINVVQFDAHTDLRESYQGTSHSHACVMRHAWRLGPVVQVGIRSMSREEADFLAREKAVPLYAREVIQDPVRALEQITSRLEPLPTYVTIDLDCLDPGIMPSVGTPEPGGLGWFELTAILRGLAKATRVAAFDVVELAPVGSLHAPDYLAARLVYKFMAYILEGESRVQGPG